MNLHPLNKTVLRVRNKAGHFITVLSSNTLDKPRNAFLNQYGRIVATFDQIKTGEDEFLIVLESSALDAFMFHVGKFLLLNKTTAEPAGLNAYFDLDGSYRPAPGEYAIAQKTGQMVLTPQKLPADVSGEEFTLFRLKNNIPLQGVDYKDELLLNIDEYERVSYTKGCFVGQEPIAKVHNRSKPTWKLVVRYEDDLSSEEKGKLTSKIADPATGKIMGFVFVSNK